RRIDRSAVFRLEEFAMPDKDVVYHYTDQNGIKGILETQELWCTHIAYMNDASEHGFAEKLMLDALKSLAESTDAEPRMRDLAKRAKDFWKGWTTPNAKQEEIFQSPIRGDYIGSFSKESDDLSLWRAYSITGSRFSIGFRTDFLTPFNFWEVKYDADEAMQAMKDKFISHIKWSTEHPNSGPFGHPYDGHSGETTELCRMLIAIGLRYKHSKFRAEREWRISGTTMPKRKFRNGKSFIIPYGVVELPPDKKPIASIIVGPCAHRELSVSSVRDMLLMYDWQKGRTLHDYIPVTMSQVPYRDW
ncbi:MAG TPA: DUF2971 domain-containing protein, partial [Chthoniobacterales bacterium]|nr:DUF2971 domain-containing protein [Chthoniobacterales bacterium]